jgi:hypothetical protein
MNEALQAKLAKFDDATITAALLSHLRDEWDDYSASDLREQLCDWARAGVKGYEQMTRAELLEAVEVELADPDLYPNDDETTWTDELIAGKVAAQIEPFAGQEHDGCDQPLITDLEPGEIPRNDFTGEPMLAAMLLGTGKACGVSCCDRLFATAKEAADHERAHEAALTEAGYDRMAKGGN